MTLFFTANALLLQVACADSNPQEEFLLQRDFSNTLKNLTPEERIAAVDQWLITHENRDSLNIPFVEKSETPDSPNPAKSVLLSEKTDKSSANKITSAHLVILSPENRSIEVARNLIDDMDSLLASARERKNSQLFSNILAKTAEEQAVAWMDHYIGTSENLSDLDQALCSLSSGQKRLTDQFSPEQRSIEAEQILQQYRSDITRPLPRLQASPTQKP